MLGPLLQLLIARLLVPEDFGAFAVSIAWLSLYDMCKDFGLGQAIVVQRGGSEHVSLQFTTQLITATIFCVLSVLMAPLASRYFAMPALATLLPIVAAVPFLAAVADPLVTQCLLTQRYSHLALRQVAGPLANGMIGLALAFLGYGVYSLAGGLVAGHVVATAFLLPGTTALPRLYLEWSKFKDLLSVGIHVLMQRTFGFLVGQSDSLIVGRFLGPHAVGFYRMANMLAFLLPSATVLQLQQVVFTEVSATQNANQIRRHYSLHTNIVGPALLAYGILTYLLAPVMIPFLLGAQWQAAVPIMQIFGAVVITGFLTPLNMEIAKVLGFAHTYSYYAAVRSLLTVAAVLVSAQYSVVHVAVTWVVIGLLASLANDVIFYAKQKIVPLTRFKIAIVAASWAWGVFVILNFKGIPETQ